jgi:hypothetical protein
MRYVVNRSKVVLEHFDDETILINMSTCVYFSLNRSGCEVWKQAEAGRDAAAITAALAQRYTGDPAAIARSVEAILAELVSVGLLEPSAGDDAALHVLPVETPAPGASAATEPFVAPSLSRYHDMQELLLLDPIHDVDASGWPNAHPQALAGVQWK